MKYGKILLSSRHQKTQVKSWSKPYLEILLSIILKNKKPETKDNPKPKNKLTKTLLSSLKHPSSKDRKQSM